MHFYRFRMGERDATRAAILAVTGAARKLSRKRVAAGSLFERADELLGGGGQRLSAVHRADRAALADLLRDIEQHDRLPRFGERLQASGVASETAVVYLLQAGEALLITNPEAAAVVFEGAADMSALLRDSPRELVQSLQGHAYVGRANALRLLGKYDDALSCLAAAGERFLGAVYCADEAGRTEYVRATIYLHLEQWEEALSVVRLALGRFKQSANTGGAAKAEVLEAITLFELGDVDAAYAKWIRLTTVFATLRQRNDLAKVWLNLGNCEIRRNRPAEAQRWLAQADAAFRKLGNAAELARTRWNMGTFVATFGDDVRRALRHWTKAYRGFLDLHTWLDAGFVGLDMLEAMVEAGTPDEELTLHANSVADTLARAHGIGERIARSLDQLRRIVQHDDRRRVLRQVRAALNDSKANRNEIAVSSALGETGLPGLASRATDSSGVYPVGTDQRMYRMTMTGTRTSTIDVDPPRSAEPESAAAVDSFRGGGAPHRGDRNRGRRKRHSESRYTFATRRRFVVLPMDQTPSVERASAAYAAHYEALRFIAAQKFRVPAADVRPLIHDVFVSYMRHVAAIGDDRGWLITATKHACLNYWRDAKPGAPLPDVLLDPRTFRDDVEVKLDLARILRGVPKECVRVLKLRYVDGAAPADIAAELDKKRSYGRQMVHRCLTAAREVVASIQPRRRGGA